MEDGPNLFRVSEKGWDKGSLEFNFIPLEVPVDIFGHDRAAGDGLMVSRGVNGVLISKRGVIILVFRIYLLSNDVNEENSQYAADAGQDGLHLIECLSG